MENNKLKLSDIPQQANYEGYLWWRNDQTPKVYKNEPLPEWPGEKANPFIIEGQLFDKENQKSYSIRLIDGEYLIHKYNLKKMDLEKQEKKYETIVKYFLPNRFPDSIQKLCFKEFWRPAKDELCEGMDVLQPAENVFVGFNKCKEE
jgi:CRISPR type III-associated protein (TIGR04423 family)